MIHPQKGGSEKQKVQQKKIFEKRKIFVDKAETAWYTNQAVAPKGNGKTCTLKIEQCKNKSLC